MNEEIKTTLKKTAKIAGVTCFALGGAALIASAAALKAIAEGARYTKDSIKEILNEGPEAPVIVEAEATEVETSAEEAPEEAPDTQEES